MPTRLAASEPTGSPNRLIAGLSQREFPGQVGGDFAIADRSAGGPPGRQPFVEQPCHLIDEPRLKHLIDPLLDARVHRLPIDEYADLDGPRIDVRRLRQARVIRLPSQFDDLQGAHDPPSIVRKNLARRDRVERRQPVMQSARSDLRQLGLKSRSHRSIGAGEVELVDHRARVERRPTNQDGRTSSRPDGLNLCSGPPLELGHGRRFGDGQPVQEVMRDPSPLALRHLRGADLHPAVESHGVGIHDLAIESFGKVKGELGLAGGRGTYDGDDHGSGHGR